MERLTKRRPDGRAVFAGNGSPTENAFMIPNVLNRLAAYEDTGLEPEVIKDMAENVETRLLVWFQERYGFPVGVLMGLIEAKQDGRLVILPVKVGEPVWRIVTRRPKISMPAYSYLYRGHLTYLNALEIAQNFGKTAFLTKAEAEAALEKMKGDQNGIERL